MTDSKEVNENRGTGLGNSMRAPTFITGMFLIVSFAGSASAASLDGSYISNKNNQMRISGTSYVYIPREGTTNPTNVRSKGSVRSVGENVYKFSGHLNYACTLSGTTLNCAGGRRIWTKL